MIVEARRFRIMHITDSMFKHTFQWNIGRYQNESLERDIIDC